MESEIIQHINRTKYYEDLYSIPWKYLEGKPCQHTQSLRIGLINVPCGGFGDIISCSTFYTYLKQWYPKHTVTLCTTTPSKFKQLGIKDIQFRRIYVEGDDECESYDKLYFKQTPKQFDVMICIPIINYQFDIKAFRKFIPYANLMNTFTVSEYNGVVPPYTFPIGIGKDQLGLFLTNPKVPKTQLIQGPFALVYIADRSNPAGIHCRLCFLLFLEMICKLYHKQHRVFQVVVPPWIPELLSESANFRSRFRSCVSTYFTNVWIVHPDTNKDMYFEGDGNTLIIRGDILPQPRHEFMSLIKSSVDDVLLTGDQSITDAFSCCSSKKKIWYQIAPWKADFAESMAKEIPDKTILGFRTSCGVLKGIHQTKDYTQFLKQYDFRKLGKRRMDAVLHSVYKKDEFEDFLDILSHSRTIESVAKKWKKKYKIE